MENVEFVENKNKCIFSTVIIGILLIISIYFTIVLIPIDIGRMLHGMAESSQEAGSSSGTVAVAFAGAIVGAVAVVLLHGIAISLVVVSGISLIFTIKNRRSYLKPIRIINYIYDGLLGSIIVIAIIKIILFRCGH